MKAEILAVGTEILLGDIINTNAQFISKELASLGIDVYRQEVIGDNEDRLLEAMGEIFQRSDILICTGGLGPTEDDLTKETICKYFNADLEVHEESLTELKNYYKRLDREMTESNLKQVYFPKESKVLANPNGTAPGMILEKNDKVVVILPGPPREMKPMFLNYVRPYLKDKGNGVIVSEVLRVLGVGESTAANMIKDFINKGINPTVAPYAKEDDVIFRITARGKSEDDGRKLIAPVKEEIKRVFNLDCYGEGEELTIEEVLGKLLVDRKLTISTAESCTGGMIASRLINYPGISEVFLEGAVTYSNEAKERTLNVKKETLDIYGAVSEETAKEMAIGISKRTGSDISVVTTGIAGPGGGSEEKPVGLVYIGLYYKGKVKAFKYIFNGNRHNVRTKATVTALDLVRREILKDN